MKRFRDRGVGCIAIVGLALAVAAPALAQASHRVLQPAEALRLMKLDEQLQEAEEAALAADADYQATKAEADAAAAALADHRAAFEARRDADPDYSKARRRFTQLNENIERLDREITKLRSENALVSRTVHGLRAKSAKVNRSVEFNRGHLEKWEKHYHTISTQTATTLAGYAHLEKKIDRYRGLVNEGETELATIQADLDEAEASQAALEEALTPLRDQRLKDRAELEEVGPEYKTLTQQWEDQYRGDEDTIRLEHAAQHAALKLEAARDTCLTKLQRSDPQYAKALRERTRIMPREDAPAAH